MAIDTTGRIIHHQLWQQGDIRDPLGIWAARIGVTGDATGVPMKVGYVVDAAERAAFIHTVYDIQVSKLTGVIAAVNAHVRLLTNWPDATPGDAGVQGYASHRLFVIDGDPAFTAPIMGTEGLHMPLIQPNDRFLLLFDPRPSILTDLEIISVEVDTNTLAETWSFEAYGYYWDRSVLNAPGGLRHPGSN